MSSAEILRHSASSRAPKVSEWPGRRRKAPSTITALALTSWSSSALNTAGGPRLLFARRRERLGQEAEALELGARRLLQKLVDIDRPQVARQAEAACLDETRFQPQQLGQHLRIGFGQRGKLGQ